MSETPVAAIVLAGGKSLRFGRDKASVLLNGAPLLQHALDRLTAAASDVVIVTAAGQELPPISTSARVTVVEDLHPESGPLGGLYTGLRALDGVGAVAVACDMPLIEPALIRELARLLPGHDAVVPLSEGGRPQPLCAAYSKTCLEQVKRRLDAGRLQLTALLGDLRVLEVAPETWRRFDPAGLSFLNANTEAELAGIEALISGHLAREADQGVAFCCEVWYGRRQCRQPATHRTQHSGVLACAAHASIWGGLYEEAVE